MKKISLLLIAIVITISGFSQEKTAPIPIQIHKYRAYQTKEGDNGTWEPRNILVVINPEKEKIHIYGQTETDISIINKESESQRDDGVATFFRGVDQDGQDCEIMIKMFKEDGTPGENVALLIVIYKEARLFFSLKKD
jgi:hypothetical protein